MARLHHHGAAGLRRLGAAAVRVAHGATIRRPASPSLRYDQCAAAAAASPACHAPHTHLPPPTPPPPQNVSARFHFLDGANAAAPGVGTRSARATATRGFTAAAAAAAAVVGVGVPSVSWCDGGVSSPPGAQPSRTGSGMGAGPGGGPSGRDAGDGLHDEGTIVVGARRALREARVEERARREASGAPRPPRLPEPAVFLRNKELVVRFTAPAPAPFPAADLGPLAVDTIARLESSSGSRDHGAGGAGVDAKRRSRYVVQAHCSDVAYQLLVTPGLSAAGRGGGHVSATTGEGEGSDKVGSGGSLSALFVAPRFGSSPSEVEFSKNGPLTAEDAAVIIGAVSGGWLRGGGAGSKSFSPAGAAPGPGTRAFPRVGAGAGKNDAGKRGAGGGAEPEAEDIDALVTQLEDMGVRVFINDGKAGGDHHQANATAADPPLTSASATWGALVGYEEQKREIEDTLLLALLRPDVYDAIAAGTRVQAGSSNRPRALLFEGPPGTGKTSAARAIAARAAVTMVYVPLEAVASKYYGESERLLAQVFQLCDRLEGAVVFLDEVDALAQARGGEMHEATRRVLSVLLRRIDGLDSRGGTVVVAATNRKQDLDPALVSRFDAAVVGPVLRSLSI